MKRIITIQDISCVGKCSLTVALPIISAAGVEACVLPTALLSTHTVFSSFSFLDLTDSLPSIDNVFHELDLTFDAIYTGYLGSFEQIAFVEQFLESRKSRQPIVIIDPVMGDHGKLYAGFTQEFSNRMAQLCSHADLLLPNMTEAAYLLREPYLDTYTEDDIRGILLRLSKLGAKRVALTGISLTPDKVGCYLYDSTDQSFYSYFNDKLPSVHHGTGDVFASCVTGAYMRGIPLRDALALGVDFTLESIRATLKDPHPIDYGVNFEEALPMLIERLKNGAGF